MKYKDGDQIDKKRIVIWPGVSISQAGKAIKEFQQSEKWEKVKSLFLKRDYDLRYPELGEIYIVEGATVLIYPTPKTINIKLISLPPPKVID